MEPENEMLNLNEYGEKNSQQVKGTFLYYARAVDSTMLVALSPMVSEQVNPINTTTKKVKSS